VTKGHHDSKPAPTHPQFASDSAQAGKITFFTRTSQSMRNDKSAFKRHPSATALNPKRQLWHGTAHNHPVLFHSTRYATPHATLHSELNLLPGLKFKSGSNRLYWFPANSLVKHVHLHSVLTFP
jgi:hypothetical protein